MDLPNSDYPQGPASAFPTAPADAAVYAPPSVPMYVAAFIVTLCGLYAVNLVLPEDGSSFFSLTLSLSVIGFLVSYLSRRQRIAPRNIELPAVIVCAMFCLAAVFSDSALSVLAPPGIGDDRARSLAILLIWLSVFRSYTLINDASLLFCCVPTLAMVGLASTMSSEAALLTTFIVFVAASAFLMIHENFMRTRPVQNSAPRSRMGGLMFGSQLQLTALCLISALLLARIVAGPMSQIGGYMLFGTSLVPPGKVSKESTSQPRVNFSEEEEKRVGTGPVQASSQVVMFVRADHGAYWRGATFDQYTGRGWRNTMRQEQNISPQSASSDVNDILNSPSSAGYNIFDLPASSLTQTRGGSRMRQRFSLRNGLFSEIYAASEPRKVYSNEERLFADQSGAIHLYHTIQSQSYEVESEVPDTSPETLEASPARYPEAITGSYLNLPDTPAIERVRIAARQVVAGLKTPYSKARRLEEWVGKQCKYNLNAPAVPTGQDVVEHFLFQERQGYCDSFATSLAVACRAVGIPARVASGFRSGDLDQMTGEYVVRERDKHMWTEVFFPASGWVAFDSTAYAEDITDNDRDSRRNRSSLAAFLFGRGWLPPMALGMFCCMLAYVLKVEVLDRRRGRTAKVNPLGLPETNLAVVAAYEAASGELARRGIRRPPPLTPREFLRDAAGRLAPWPEAQAALERLTLLVVRYRYSRETASDEDVRLAQEALVRLRHALRGVNRRMVLAAQVEQA